MIPMRQAVRFVCLAGLAAGVVFAAVECGTKNSKISEPASTAMIGNLKVTATGDDLCRIVVEHAVFIDTIDYDTKNVVMTLLSDGSEVKQVFDESSLKELYVNFNNPSAYFLSQDTGTVVYDAGFGSATGNHHNVYENVFFYKGGARADDSLFSEDSVYTHTGYGMFIGKMEVNPAGNWLAVSTTDFLRLRNLMNGSSFDIPAKVSTGLQWIGNDVLIYNRGYNKKFECRRLDLASRKTTSYFPDDTLSLQSASTTENGNRILTYASAEDTSGSIGDSLFFRDSGFHVVSASLIRHEQTVFYKIGPEGRWLYYNDNRALRRIRIEDVEGKNVALDRVNERAQVIYPFPIRVVDNEIKDVGNGIIMQLLPIQNGKK